ILDALFTSNGSTSVASPQAASGNDSPRHSGPVCGPSVGDIDEYPRFVAIETINTCNARCPFCPLFQGSSQISRAPVAAGRCQHSGRVSARQHPLRLRLSVFTEIDKV